jgi:DNA-binding transcriptional LysR family regulator
MELRHLRYFITVAEELHFGHAAEKLLIAQPPLSQQIRQLEDEIGVELFRRTKRKVELTESGKVFLEEARAALKQVESAVRAAQRAKRGEIGHLTLGFVGSAAYQFLPPVVRRYREQFPGVELELHEMTTAQQVTALENGQINVGLLRPPIESLLLVSEIVTNETLVVALPENHELVTHTTLNLTDLRDMPFIIFPRLQGASFYDQIINICQQAGFQPRIVQEAVQMHTIVSLVAAEIGIALVPASVQNLGRSGVTYRTLAEKPPATSLALAWLRDVEVPVLQNFIAIAKEIARI